MTASGGLFLLAPRGDGSNVVVIPGFTASDSSTLALRTLLAQLGHRPVGWGLGPNLGPSRSVRVAVEALVRRLHDEDGRAVQLVGWSLGGVLARHVATRCPDIVRRVITLGSPYRLDHMKTGPAAQPLAVPTTSIYSPSDGIVPRSSCTEAESRLAENVAIHGSHNGLGHNALAMYVVADRLALPSGALPRFTPPAAIRALFATDPAQLTRRSVKARG
jgi:pimeloyl-ACP methyl ester carboxylesterase